MITLRMKTAALFLSIATLQGVAIAASPLAAAPAAAQEADSSELTLTFQGITQTSGNIRGLLFASEETYRGKGEPIASFVVPASGPTVSTVVPGLKPGRYAVKAFHDVDGDEKMGTNPFGIPTEPFAFSNNATGAFGPAAWADAAFDVGAGQTVHTITID